MNTGGDVMKILVTGVTGQLGYDVARVCRERGMEVVGATRAEMPLTDLAACRSFIEKVRPEAIVHCAAYTAVDRAEDEPALCRAVNASATGAVAETAEAVGAKLIYISTDYVFPGTGETFYETDAEKEPKNVYGASKLAGELAATSAMKSGRLFIVRISWVFGINGKNFIRTILGLAKTRDAHLHRRPRGAFGGYGVKRALRRLSRDERKHLLLGGAGGGGHPSARAQDEGDARAVGILSDEGGTAKEFASVKIVAGRGGLFPPAGLAGRGAPLSRRAGREGRMSCRLTRAATIIYDIVMEEKTRGAIFL